MALGMYMQWFQRLWGKLNDASDNHGLALASGLFGIALILLVLPHWGMWLSNSDDPWITRQTLPEVFQTASSQGRFWLIPINLLAQLPYRAGSWELANAIKMLVNACTLFAFVVFCSKATDKKTGLLVGSVWLAFIDVSPGYYSPFHGFLLMFNLQFAVLFISFAWYVHKLNRDVNDAIVGPYLLFAFALLAYEPMLFYAGVFPFLALMRHGEKISSPQAAYAYLRAWLYRNSTLFLVVLAYVLTYYAYRHFQPGAGRSIDFEGSLAAILKTIYRFSLNGFHLEMSPSKAFVPGHTRPSDLVLATLYGVVVASCFAWLLPRIHLFEKVSLRKRYLIMAVVIFYIFIPNVLHGFVESYRQWAADDPHYVGNYISSFAFAIGVALLVIFLAASVRARQERALYLICIFIVFSSSVDNHLRWRQLSSINRADVMLWKKAISDLSKKDFSGNDRLVQICGKHAPEKVSGDDKYWSSRLSELLAFRVQFRSKNIQPIDCDIVIEFNDYRF